MSDTNSRYPVLDAFREELVRLAVERACRPAAAGGLEEKAGPPGWQEVRWPGAGSFWLDAAQLRVVRLLADAAASSASPDVEQERCLIVAAAKGARRLAEVFRGSPAWGTLVVAGSRPGSYRLAEPGEPGEDSAA